MNPQLKQRLTGAIVLVILGVIFLPMLLEKPTPTDVGSHVQNITLPRAQGAKSETQAIPAKSNNPSVSIPDEILSQYEPDSSDLPLVSETPTLSEPKEEITIAAKPIEATAEVEKPIVTAEKPVVEKKATAEEEEAEQEWFIQAGSFSSVANADLLVRRLKSHEFEAFHERVVSTDRALYRVRLGPYASKQAATDRKNQLEKRETIRTIIVRLPKGGQ